MDKKRAGRAENFWRTGKCWVSAQVSGCRIQMKQIIPTHLFHFLLRGYALLCLGKVYTRCCVLTHRILLLVTEKDMYCREYEVFHRRRRLSHRPCFGGHYLKPYAPSFVPWFEMEL